MFHIVVGGEGGDGGIASLNSVGGISRRIALCHAELDGGIGGHS